MLKPARMEKLKVVGLKKQQHDIIKSMHKQGALHIVDIRDRLEEEEWKELASAPESYYLTRDFTQLIIRLDRISDIFESVKEGKKKLLAVERIEKIKIKELKPEEIVKTYKTKVEELDTEVTKLNSRKEEITEEKSHLKKLANFYKCIELLGIEPTHIEESKFTQIYLGFMSKESFMGFGDEIGKKIGPEFGLFSKEYEEEKVLFLLTVLQKSTDDTRLLLRHFGFEELEVPRLSVEPGQVEEKQAQAVKEIKDIKAKIRELSKKWKNVLRVMKEQLEIEHERAEVYANLLNTDNTFVLEGWVPKKSAADVVKKLGEVSKGYVHVEEIEPGEGEEIPVMLDNPNAVKPYEMLTEMYAQPKYNELDPTLIMAPVFIIFAGFMLTDFFYGLIVAVAGLIIWKKFGRNSKGTADLGKIVTAIGVSAIAWGVLTGSYVGNLFYYLMGVESSVLALVADPLVNPIFFLQLSLILGLIHLNMGLVMGIYKNYIQGKLRNAIPDQIIWFFIQIAGLYFAGKLFGFLILPEFMSYVSIALFIGSVLILIKAKGIIGLFSLTGFLGDFVSYTRLLALCLATGGIAMTFNLLANMVWGLPYVGFVVGLVIFIIGQLFSITMNTLGAFIHSLRLHYVEFFNKFYEGGGNRYNPFKESRRYTKL